MLEPFKNFRNSLSFRLIFSMGLVLFISFSAWAFFNIRYQRDKMMKDIVIWTDRLSETIKLGTHYAHAEKLMNRTSPMEKINRKTIEHIRIYNKEGEIKFSNKVNEVGHKTNIKAEACYICHKLDPPVSQLDLSERIRFFSSPNGYRLIGIITPIRNDTGCSTDVCHVHPENKQVLGALDVVVSLKETDDDILFFEEGIIILAGFIFTVASIGICLFIFRFVRIPITKLIEGTRRIATGDYYTQLDIERHDELGELAAAFQKMGKEVGDKQFELNNQRNEYQKLFEQVEYIPGRLIGVTGPKRQFRRFSIIKEIQGKLCQFFHISLDHGPSLGQVRVMVQFKPFFKDKGAALQAGRNIFDGM